MMATKETRQIDLEKQGHERKRKRKSNQSNLGPKRRERLEERKGVKRTDLLRSLSLPHA